MDTQTLGGPVLPETPKPKRWALVGELVAFAVVAFGAYAYFYVRHVVPHNPSTQPQVQDAQMVSTTTEAEPTLLPVTIQGSGEVPTIRYLPIIGATPIRTIDTHDNISSRVDVYAAGEFLDGPYKGDTLAVFTRSWVPVSSKPAERGISMFGYFVSDKAGTPIAWDDTQAYWFGDMFGQTPLVGSDQVATSYSKIIHTDLGVTEAMRGNLAVLPEEFRFGATIASKDKKANFFLHYTQLMTLIPSSNWYGTKEVVGTTKNGFAIVRRLTGAGQPASVVNLSAIGAGVFVAPPSYAYFIELPFGTLIDAYVVPPFWKGIFGDAFPTESETIPDVHWNRGSSNVSYHLFRIFGGSDVASVSSFAELEKSLVQTGVSAGGDPVYEPGGEIGARVYGGIAANLPAWKGKTAADVAIAHPLIFWKNAYGEWQIYARDDFQEPRGGHD